MKVREALVVFAKPPERGRVKTRLIGAISADEAADLYAAFLRDALRCYERLGPDVRLFWNTPAGRLHDDLVPASVTVHRQQGSGLGKRMQQAFAETFGAGYERIVIIGTDHPTLPPAFITRAFAALGEPCAVSIGPSADGGYYLVGMNALYPQLFAGMTYSHAEVFGQTLARVQQTNARLTVLPEWYDVDTPETLRQLIAELPDSAEPLVHTRRVVADLVEAHPELRA